MSVVKLTIKLDKRISQYEEKIEWHYSQVEILREKIEATQMEIFELQSA